MERWDSPEETLPNVPTAPSPDVDESDVDPELLGLWWRSVALANVALGGVAVGLMVVAFRGWWRPGLAGIVLGLLAGFRLYQHYRLVEARGESEQGDSVTDDRTAVDDERSAVDGDPTASEGDRAATDAGDPDDGRNA